MRPRFFPAALVLPALVAVATAQLVPQLGGLSRNSSALRLVGVDCGQLPTSCVSSLPATALAWAGGTGYDATSGEFWVSEGHVLARLEPRGCAISCGPYQAPVLNAVVTGLDVLERTNELLVLDSNGVLTTLSLSGSCFAPQLVAVCGTGLVQQGQLVTSGLAADEARDLVFVAYTDFATGANEIAVVRLQTSCVPIVRLPLPGCTTIAFGRVRGLAVDACARTLYATDGYHILSVRYQFDPIGPVFGFGAVDCCSFPSATLDPIVGLALRPHPGVAVGQGCSNGACRPCAMRHELLTGPVLGNPNLLFHLDNAQGSTWTWLGLGFGGCNNTGPVIHPLCGPLLLGGASAATPPLVAGPFPVTGGAGLCTGSATVVVPFPYIPALCGTDWSSQFVSLCFGSVGIAPYGTAMSNCLSWTVIGP